MKSSTSYLLMAMLLAIIMCLPSTLGQSATTPPPRLITLNAIRDYIYSQFEFFNFVFAQQSCQMIGLWSLIFQNDGGQMYWYCVSNFLGNF